MNDYNLQDQQDNVTSKIVIGLERISEAYRVALWNKAKEVGLSPIQLQILIFIKNHEDRLCNVSYLAKEFSMTKPTISDAVKTLLKKELIEKLPGLSDNRSFTIGLTSTGSSLSQDLQSFSNGIHAQIKQMSAESQSALFSHISELIKKLNTIGLITVQRTCFNCVYYAKEQDSHYCNLMNAGLKNDDIRLDCPEFTAS